jgi:[glutamine synthetase] adenylyltransferase / [glutamine synthetase]-adenylyl-L-tyrosine phosphorylase
MIMQPTIHRSETSTHPCPHPYLLNRMRIMSVRNFPDAVLRAAGEKWKAFLDAVSRKNLCPPDTPEMTEACRIVFAFSDFVFRSCVQNPGILLDLLDTGDMRRTYRVWESAKRIRGACTGCPDIAALSAALRRIRMREMIRIAFRDLMGWANLFETMRDLSNLAEACLDTAQAMIYGWLTDQYGVPVGRKGWPQQLVVIGVGKLGGRELNFSSDIDLMFAFPEAGKTTGGATTISNEDFFARHCRRLIQVIGDRQIDGIVFRVDARLRPFGDSGPIAMSFDATESYYQQQGREWERYALIKARIVAGDRPEGRALLDRLRPFVYRRYLDYGTFESIREMKQGIARENSRKGMKENIKLGPGGIREIEFFGQVFQLIRGGLNPHYRKRGILNVLRLLAKDNGIPEPVNRELGDAYVFLRMVENRLQMADDLQTHSLPEKTDDRQRLALSMGYADWQTFIDVLDIHMKRVQRHFSQLLAADEADHPEDDHIRIFDALDANGPENEVSTGILSGIGVNRPEAVVRELKTYKDLMDADDVSLQGKNRIKRLVPQILREALAGSDPAATLRRIYELIRSIRRRSCYAALLLENPDALTRLVKLAQVSPWILSFLSRHPLLLDELLDPRLFNAPLDKKTLHAELAERMEHLGTQDFEFRMDDARIFKQINTFRIAAADVAGHLPLMKVSDCLTYLAEVILQHALEMAWGPMVEKYGLPEGCQEGSYGFALIAYGKLGGLELGYGSDLDLVFLHTGSGGSTPGGRLPPVDYGQFYSRLGQRIIHFLTTMTRTGKLYDIDMRLRPSGNAGILVSHIDSFEDYQAHSAWPWEHQALIKARFIAGDANVGNRFAALRDRILCMPRDTTDLKEAVRSMRIRMRREHGVDIGGRFDVKQDPGGVVDIEFLVQYLILLNAGRHPELTEYTDVVRQLNTLALTGIMDERSAHFLKHAYLIFRYCIHRLTLEEKPVHLPKKRFADLRGEVVRIWRSYLGA